MKVITWTCPKCGVRHKQTATYFEKAKYKINLPNADDFHPDVELEQFEPECGACGYIPLIKQTENGWEDVRWKR